MAANLDLEIDVSRQKSQTQRGQFQDTGPASTNKATLPPIKDFGQPNISAGDGVLDKQDTLGHRVKIGDDGKPASFPVHSSMQNRTPGSPSGVMDNRGNMHTAKR